MLARYAAEIEEQQQFIDGLVEAAEKEERDLTAQEMELVTPHPRPHQRSQRAGRAAEGGAPDRGESHGSGPQEIAEVFRAQSRGEPAPRAIEYRSAGEYVLDYWKAGLGADDAQERLELYNRAAAHQTTADNPGLLPEQILGPVVNFVDAARPLVTALGPRQLPSGSWSRPKITQHTQVAGRPRRRPSSSARR